MRGWQRVVDAVGAAFGIAGLLVAAEIAHAAGTPAGTVVQSAATVTFVVDGAPGTATTAPATVVVAERLEVVGVALQATVVVRAGDADRVVPFRYTNTGNGTEPYRLAVDAAVAGDEFDPVPNAPALYLDSDASGSLTSADQPYAPGTNDPVLAADASVLVFAVVDVPAGLPDPSRGRLAVAARSLTGTGAPGTALPGLGDGGGDALIGTSGGVAAPYADLVVSGFDVAVAKAATVVDAAGGARPEPGARVEYEIVVSVGGTGLARALYVRDPIPAYTSFVPGSLRLDGAALTDAADADAGRFVATPAGIEVALGDVPAGGARRVRFAVTLD